MYHQKMSKNFKDLTIFGPHNHPLSLDSGNTVEGFLRSAAVDFGRKAIALTDHGTLGAIIEAHDFSKKLLKKNIDIKVVPGVELYLMPEPWDDTAGFNKDGTPKFNYYHLTVHLDDFDSYLAACKLSRSAFDRAVWKGGELKPMTTFSELRSLSGKMTIFTGCMVSPVMKPILKGRQDVAERYFKELMAIADPGRMFIEILPYEVSKNWNRQTKTFEPIKNECIPDGRLQIACNKWGFYLSEKYDIPLVISEDAHYAHESEKPIQDLRLNKDGQDNWKMSDANCLHHTDWLYQELNRLHPEYINESKFLEMVDNGWKSFENFKSFDPQFKHALPKIDIGHTCGDNCTRHRSPDDAMVEYIVNRIIQKNKFDIKDPAYRDRLKKEIDALAYNGKINILPYFLVLEEIVDWCAQNDVLVGPGRGSAAGSLLTFGLGITSVDPIKEDLSFERFFDVSRVEEGLADIDTDFSNKNKVVEFVKERWGDKFAFLGTGTTFKTKSALKDIDRLLYGSVREETDRICKLIPQSPQGVHEEDFLRGYKDADGNWQEGELHKNMELRAYLENNVQSASMLFKMVGLIRQMGRHAAGVLIADKPIHDFIPVMKISDEITTQLLPKWVEKCGGVKYDLLGLNTLEDIRICLKNIEKRHNLKLDPWNLPDDPKVWEAAVKDPETIFQLHTETVRPGLRLMKPRSVQEGAILTAVFRPGAMDAPSMEDPQVTMDEIFLNRWTGIARTWYIHQDLEPILGNTKGVIVFQEQIMEIAHKLGGLSMPETQKLRKAISKKASDDLIVLLNKVQDNLVANRGWTEKQAEAVCDQMKASGKYAFNKAHSCIAGNQMIRTNNGGLVSMGELVKTRNAAGHKIAYMSKDASVQFEEPINFFEQGVKDVYEVELEDGSIIRCTADHKFYFDGEWKSIEDVVPFMSIGKRRVRCACGKTVTKNTLKEHIQNSKCTLDPSRKSFFIKILNIKTKHEYAWRKADGENAVMDKSWFMDVINGHSNLSDWSMSPPRAKGVPTPKTRARMSIQRAGVNNPLARTKPKYDIQQIKIFAEPLKTAFFSLNMSGKDILKQIEVKYPYFKYNFSIDAPTTGRGRNKDNYLLARLFDVDVDLIIKTKQLYRGRFISSGLLGNENFRSESRDRALRALKTRLPTKPHAMLYKKVLNYDHNAIIEYKVGNHSYDIYSPKINCLIEMHGHVWHAYGSASHKNPKMMAKVKRNIYNDNIKYHNAIENKYQIAYFWDNCQEIWEAKLAELFKEFKN